MISLSPLHIQTSLPSFLSLSTVAFASGLGGSAIAKRAQRVYPASCPTGGARDLIATRTIDFASSCHFPTISVSVPGGEEAGREAMNASLPIQTSKVSFSPEVAEERTTTPLRPRPTISSVEPAVVVRSEG